MDDATGARISEGAWRAHTAATENVSLDYVCSSAARSRAAASSSQLLWRITRFPRNASVSPGACALHTNRTVVPTADPMATGRVGDERAVFFATPASPVRDARPANPPLGPQPRAHVDTVIF